MNVDSHRARKRFGQNFLHDPAIIQKIINIINPDIKDHIVEIGPGKGALTTHLLKNVNKLDVLEIDRDLVCLLSNNLGNTTNLSIHEVDALNFDFESLGYSDIRIIGNLPYNISTPLLFYLLSFSTLIKDMVFMLQKEVVDRICAKPDTKQYGRLSVMLQYYCEVESLLTIKPGAFNPSPKVDSAIVRLKPRKKRKYNLEDEACFAEIVKQAFTQRRKTIRNSLKNLLDTSEIKNSGILPNKRPENLLVEEYVSLANTYHELINQ